MLPTLLALCVLLLVLDVLFGFDLPTRLRSGRKGVNQGHGFVWQSCPFLVLVCFLCFAFQRTNASWFRCTVRFRKAHQFDNTQPYGVCFVFMSSWWKSRTSLSWLSSLAAERKSPWGVSRAFSEEPQTWRLSFGRPVILMEWNSVCWFRFHLSMLSHQDAVSVCLLWTCVSACWVIVNWFISFKIIF